MSIILSRESHIHYVGMVSPPGLDMDALFAVWRPPGEEETRLTYRFRTGGQGEDRRSWTDVKPGAGITLSPAEMISDTRLMMAETFHMTFGIELRPEYLSEVHLDCDGLEAALRLSKEPWWQPVSTMPAAEGEQ